MGYTATAVRGVSWITLLRVATRVLTFVRLAILGRLLTPAQFGLFGIASLLLAFLEIFTETGINVFLVQQKGHIKEYLNSAWVVSIVRGVILSLLIICLTPIIAHFFNVPDAYSILLLIALVPFIRGFINPAIISYQKDLLFHKEFVFRSILFFVDVVISIIVGFITRSAESFVWGLIAAALVEVFLSYALLSLWPKLHYSIAQIKLIIKRGWWVTLTGIFAYFADNGDNIAVGKLLGAGNLGIYQVAYKFSTLPISEVTNVVNQVIFPVYSKFSHDLKRLKKAFIKVTIGNFFISILFGAVIYFFAEPILTFVMGDQWSQAVQVIKVLAIFGVLRTIFGSFSALFLSIGKQDYVAKMTFVRVAGLLISIVPFITWYGMVGAGYAMLLSIFVEIPIILYYTYRVFKR